MTQGSTGTFKTALKEAREAFDAATKRLEKLALEKSMLDREVTRLRRAITALAAMCSESPLIDNLGITDSCVEIMENEPRKVTTADVVEALEKMGFDMASQKNASASVHSVLSRLALKGKIEKITDNDRKVTWKGPKYDPDYDDIPF